MGRLHVRSEFIAASEDRAATTPVAPTSAFPMLVAPVTVVAVLCTDKTTISAEGLLV